MTCYLVTANGYRHPWRCEYYIVGIYDTKEEAEKVAIDNMGGVLEVEMNKTYPLKEDEFGDLENELYIGGYYV